MHYARYGDKRTATFSLSSGTVRSGYPVSALGTDDPSELFWANETEVAIGANLGSALEVQAVGIFNHNFAAGTNLRLQATGIDVPFTIETPYLNDYAVDTIIDLAAVVPSAVTRTKQNWTITNVGDANDVAVAIGEVWFIATWRHLGPRGPRHDYRRLTEDLVAFSTSKRGVQTVYDLGSRAREFVGTVITEDVDEVLDWYDAQRGRVYPTVVVLDQDGDTVRDREPHLCRFTSSRRELQAIKHDTAGQLALAFVEMGRGERIDPSGSPA